MTMIETVPISRTGYNKLQAELGELQKELTEVKRLVAEAAEHGDLKENAEYQSGRERQGFIVGRISEIKGKINRSDIVDCTKVQCDQIVFGTVVTLLDLDSQKNVVYQLLGPDDADFKTGSISVHSPIGRAILGHRIGEKFSVDIPAGERHFEVQDIARPEVD